MKKVPYEQSFEYKHPELAKEWHPIKNGKLKPSDVWSVVRTDIDVWWLLPYDDPVSGKHFNFEWKEKVENRVRGYKCPYLTGKKVWQRYNDLQTLLPDIAKEWHPTRNGDLKPTDVTVHSSKYVWWYLPYDDPETGDHFDFEWHVKIHNRTSGYGCPYISGNAVWRGYNDLASKKPDLACEWHPKKNGNLTASDVTIQSGKKVWWLYPYNDPHTGKHFNFEWQATVASRVNGNCCPYISGKAVWPGYNDLATLRHDLAIEWHPTKNGDLRPTDVTEYSNKKVWWIYLYDDPVSGKHFDFEWEETISNRVINCNCPFLSGHKVYQGFNDLATVRHDLAIEWHPMKNGDLSPTDVTEYSNKKVWWIYPYDDPVSEKHFDFEWCVSVGDRKNHNCPYLDGQKAWKGYNDLLSVNPFLAKEWHPTKNGTLTPSDVTVHSHVKVWWIYPYDDPKTGTHFDFVWKASPHSRVSGKTRCPYLTNNAVWPGYNDLKTINPELAEEWDYHRNRIMPDKVGPNSNKKVWWICSRCGNNWRANICNRNKGKRCKEC